MTYADDPDACDLKYYIREEWLIAEVGGETVAVPQFTKDLNQAIAFAEWALRKHPNLELYISLSALRAGEIVGIAAMNNLETGKDQCQKAVEEAGLAEAIVQATLAALEGVKG